MVALLKLFRYSVFGSFVVCNTLIATIAIWNLSLIHDAIAVVPSSYHTDAYLIFVGCAGLLSIFPIIFCDIAESHFFITKAWFECAWAGLFCIFELAAAAASTAAGAQELCGSSAVSFLGTNLSCTSNQVLQAFSWICTIILLSYFLVLFVTSLFKARNEDPTIWHCAVHSFPWMSSQSQIGSAPVSPEGQGVPDKRSSIISRFRWSKTPSIAAPRPRNAANQDTMRHAILSYRSGLSLEYQIEHFSEAPRADVERPMPPIPSAQNPEHPVMSTREAAYATFGNALYPQQVQSVLSKQPAFQPERQRTQRPSPPSPNPLGNWPQLNPPTRGPGAKRKVPPMQPHATSVSPQVPALKPLAALDLSAEMSSFAPDLTSTPPQQTRESRRPSTRLPPSEISRNMVRPPPPAATSSSPPVTARPIIPPSAFNPSPRKPSGPRRPSLDEKKPAPLDLSNISNFNKKRSS